MEWSPHFYLNSVQVNFHGTLNGKAMFWILTKNDCKIANLNLSLENESHRKKKMPFKNKQTYFYQIGNSRCLVVLHSKLLQGKMDSTKKNQLRNDIP